jgi:ABC-2 type transport system ATP-binding protein
MITIKNLRKSFGEKIAVDIESLTINEGEMVGLVGNNGAGKTTLFRLMIDLLKADEGEVTLDLTNPKTGQKEQINPTENEHWKDSTGAYIDEGFLIDFLTPEEYFEFIGKVNNMTSEEINQRQQDFTQLMGGEILEQKKYIRNLSAGNKQKVGIIAALFNQPQLVILDEPFNFLDPSSQIILKKSLKDYCEQHGATVLISSHNLQHTIDISTRIILMEHGKLIKDLPNENGSAENELEAYFNL